MPKSIDGQDMRPPTAIEQMSPAAATAALVQKTADYRAAQASAAGAVPPPPAGVQASTPGQAAAQLAQLKADPQWRQRVLTGSAAQVQEFQNLVAMAASGDALPDTGIEFVDAVTSTATLRRSDYEKALDGLRETNNLPHSTEQYLRDVDAGLRDDVIGEGDGLIFKEAKERWLRDPAVRAKYLAGDTATVRQLNNMNCVVALAAQDGQPASDQAITILKGLGLL